VQYSTAQHSTARLFSLLFTVAQYGRSDVDLAHCGDSQSAEGTVESVHLFVQLSTCTVQYVLGTKQIITFHC
jgi:hypothetical protein